MFINFHFLNLHVSGMTCELELNVDVIDTRVDVLVFLYSFAIKQDHIG